MKREPQPADVCDLDQYGLRFYCEGCQGHHRVPVNQPSGCSWTWNGSFDKPTLAPSIHCLPVPDIGVKRCHSFVRDGQIQFLPDCEHELAGKTVPLLTPDQVAERAARKLSETNPP